MTRFEQAINTTKNLFMLLNDKNAVYANIDQLVDNALNEIVNAHKEELEIQRDDMLAIYNIILSPKKEN
jgi:hypothetical protein